MSTLVIAFILTSGATALAATISTNSTEVEPGEVVQVTGSIDLLDLDHSVTFHWGAEDGPKLGKVQLVVLVYETTVTIPETATAGEHRIYACNDTCGSTAVTVVVSTATTTTTTSTTSTTSTTTTQPDTTTTTQPDTTTTTSGDSATTTDAGPATTSPTSVGPAITTPGPKTEGEAVSTGPAVPENSSTDDGSLDRGGGVTTAPEQGEASSSDVSGIESQSFTYGPYIPPPTSTTPPATLATPSGEDGAGSESSARVNNDGEEDRDIELVAAGDNEGMPSDSPLVPWPAWLIVVLLASGAAANSLRDDFDAAAVHPRPISAWRTIPHRARRSLGRLEGILTRSSDSPLATAAREAKPHILPAPHVGDLVRHDDVYALQSKVSPIQGDVLEAIGQAMTSWLTYHFLLGDGTRDGRLAHAAEGLEHGATRLRIAKKSIEDLIGDDDDAFLRTYQIAVSGWASAFETISAGAHFDQVTLAHEGFARMSEASTIAERVVLQRSNLGQHPSLSHQLTVLRDLRPTEHVRTRAAKKAKVPWQRALQAAGSPLGRNDPSP